jgi:hypothetical protein
MRPRIALALVVCTFVIGRVADSQATPGGTFSWDVPAVGAFARGDGLAIETVVPELCGGTLIGRHTFLTAAHCLCDDCLHPPSDPVFLGPDDLWVFFQHAGFVKVSAVAIGDYDMTYIPNDIAILQLAEDVEHITPVRVNMADSPPLGTEVYFTGFGGPLHGLKKLAGGLTVECELPRPWWSTDDKFCSNIATASGDSGSGVFASVDDLLLGLAAFYTMANGTGYTDVSVQQSWIEANTDEDLNDDTCHEVAQVGDPDVFVKELGGTITLGNPIEFSFQIEEPTVETGTLYVTLNGRARARNMDLYVRQDEPFPRCEEGNPCPLDPDCVVGDLCPGPPPEPAGGVHCAGENPGAYEACEIVGDQLAGGDPPSTWYILVTVVPAGVTEERDFQVTATAVPEVEDTDGDGIGDACDNCLEWPNANQYDADLDGYGNMCDADYNDSGWVSALDYSIFRQAWLCVEGEDPCYNAEVDIEPNGGIGMSDLNRFRQQLQAPPGPSGLSCAGTTPCP